MSTRPGAKSPKSAVPTSRGGERTRHRILAAALRLFSRDGFSGTSIRALARSVGLTEAAIYYHFASKAAIVKALYEERGFLAAVDQLDHLPGALPLPDQLAANAVASARLWDENTDFLRVVIAEVLRGDRAAELTHRELMERWRRGIVDLLSRYQEKCELARDVDVGEAATSYVDMMFGAFMDRILSLGRASRRSAFLTPEFRVLTEGAAARFADRLQPPKEATIERR